MLNVTNYYDIEQMVIPSLTKLNVMWSIDMIELMGYLICCLVIVFCGFYILTVMEGDTYD